MRRLLAIVGVALMALDVKVLSFNIGTAAAGNTVTVSPGFETKAAILFWSGRTSSTDGNGAGTHLRGHGFVYNPISSSVTFACVASRSVDAQGNGLADTGHREDACILEQGDGALVGWADVQSINSTDVVFEILDQFTTDLRVTGIFLGGDEITSGIITRFTAAGAAPVDQTVSGLGFTPTLVFFMGASIAANPPGTAIDSTQFFGVAKSSTDCFVWGGGSNDGSATMITESYLRSGDVVAEYASALGSVANRATFVSMASGEYTINWAARSNATRIYSLALGGTFQSAVGSFTTQTDTTTDMTGSTSFTPKGMLFLSHNKAQNSAGGLSAHDKWSFGVATSTSEQHCQAMADRDANTNSFVSFAHEQDHIYVNMDEVNRTLQGSANLTAVVGSGFTARMTDADPSGASVCWLALGDAAAAGQPAIKRWGGVPFMRPGMTHGGVW